MRAYLGVDWSATEVTVALAGERGDPRKLKAVAPSLQSVRDLVHDASTELGAESVHVMIESGSDVWVRLFHAAGAVVHVVDSKQARRFGESLGSSGAKDDPRDAETLALMARSDVHRPEPWCPRTSSSERLGRLGTSRQQVVGDRVRVLQRIREELRRSMPLVDAALEDLDARWARALLELVPTVWHARQLTETSFREVVARASERTAQRVWDAIRRSEAPWLDETTAREDAAYVGELLEHLAFLDGRLRKLDERIEELLRESPAGELIRSMPGMGAQLTAAALEFGFDAPGGARDAASIRMGASPVFVGSGKKKRKAEPKGRAIMRRSASPRARRATYLIGRTASLHMAWARAMYAHYRARAQDAAGAYRRVARAVLRILSAMIRRNEPYDDVRYVAALKSKGVSWAAAL